MAEMVKRQTGADGRDGIDGKDGKPESEASRVSTARLNTSARQR
jgi:hypothetical protein